jgi:hypothetical protein
MIKNANADSFTGKNQLAGHKFVLLGRFGIAGRVIMSYNDGVGLVQNGWRVNLARMNQGAIEVPDRDSVDAAELVFGVKEHEHEVLAVNWPNMFPEDSSDIPRMKDAVRLILDRSLLNHQDFVNRNFQPPSPSVYQPPALVSLG